MSNVSHEFWTPLNSIVTSNEFIYKKIGILQKNLVNKINIDLTNDIQKWCKISQTSSQLLLSLVNDILDLARFENEVFKINYEDFDF